MTSAMSASPERSIDSASVTVAGVAVTTKNDDPVSLETSSRDACERSLSMTARSMRLISNVIAGTKISICNIGTAMIALIINRFRRIWRNSLRRRKRSFFIFCPP
ncbi:MAG: hypothetical protein BWY89_02029 [Bacteroidetes bacterium ADurb.BinA012]|nr:MAG: hypothetical protein BWY89_02029 [Bacteroidetes bacterium ADurb.BinA012]